MQQREHKIKCQRSVEVTGREVVFRPRGEKNECHQAG